MTFLERLLTKMRQRYFLMSVVWINYVFALNYFSNEKSEENKNEPHYEFKYGVKDSDTGDIKSHWESRKGDNVEGAYSLVEADGTIRIVQYSADERRGFNAIVSRGHKSKPLTPLPHSYRNTFENILLGGQRHIIDSHSSFPQNYYPLNMSRPVSPQAFLKQNKLFLQKQYPEKLENYKRYSYWVPDNHKPVYTKLTDQTKLVDVYNLFRERQSKTKAQKFDYGINEYFANKRNGSSFLNATRLL